MEGEDADFLQVLALYAQDQEGQPSTIAHNNGKHWQTNLAKAAYKSVGLNQAEVATTVQKSKLTIVKSASTIRRWFSVLNEIEVMAEGDDFLKQHFDHLLSDQKHTHDALCTILTIKLEGSKEKKIKRGLPVEQQTYMQYSSLRDFAGDLASIVKEAAGMNNGEWNALRQRLFKHCRWLYDTYDMPAYRLPRVTFAAPEVRWLLEAGTERETVHPSVRVQFGAIMVTEFFTGARPSSLFETADYPGQSVDLCDIEIIRLIGPEGTMLGFTIRLTLRYFKGYRNGNGKAIVYLVKTVKNPMNLIFDLGCWIVATLWDRGIFGDITAEELWDGVRDESGNLSIKLNIPREHFDEPLFIAGQPGGRGLSEKKARLSDAAANDMLKQVAKTLDLNGGLLARVSLYCFRRGFATAVIKEFGLDKAKIWMGHKMSSDAAQVIYDQSSHVLNLAQAQLDGEELLGIELDSTRPYLHASGRPQTKPISVKEACMKDPALLLVARDIHLLETCLRLGSDAWLQAAQFSKLPFKGEHLPLLLDHLRGKAAKLLQTARNADKLERAHAAQDQIDNTTEEQFNARAAHFSGSPSSLPETLRKRFEDDLAKAEVHNYAQLSAAVKSIGKKTTQSKQVTVEVSTDEDFDGQADDDEELGGMEDGRVPGDEEDDRSKRKENAKADGLQQYEEFQTEPASEERTRKPDQRAAETYARKMCERQRRSNALDESRLNQVTTHEDLAPEKKGFFLNLCRLAKSYEGRYICQDCQADITIAPACKGYDFIKSEALQLHLDTTFHTNRLQIYRWLSKNTDVSIPSSFKQGKPQEKEFANKELKVECPWCPWGHKGTRKAGQLLEHIKDKHREQIPEELRDGLKRLDERAITVPQVAFAKNTKPTERLHKAARHEYDVLEATLMDEDERMTLPQLLKKLRSTYHSVAMQVNTRLCQLSDEAEDTVSLLDKVEPVLVEVDLNGEWLQEALGMDLDVDFDIDVDMK